MSHAPACVGASPCPPNPPCPPFRRCKAKGQACTGATGIKQKGTCCPSAADVYCASQPDTAERVCAGQPGAPGIVEIKAESRKVVLTVSAPADQGAGENGPGGLWLGRAGGAAMARCATRPAPLLPRTARSASCLAPGSQCTTPHPHASHPFSCSCSREAHLPSQAEGLQGRADKGQRILGHHGGSRPPAVVMLGPSRCSSHSRPTRPARWSAANSRRAPLPGPPFPQTLTLTGDAVCPTPGEQQYIEAGPPAGEGGRQDGWGSRAHGGGRAPGAAPFVAVCRCSARSARPRPPCSPCRLQVYATSDAFIRMGSVTGQAFTCPAPTCTAAGQACGPEDECCAGTECATNESLDLVCQCRLSGGNCPGDPSVCECRGGAQLCCGWQPGERPRALAQAAGGLETGGHVLQPGRSDHGCVPLRPPRTLCRLLQAVHRAGCLRLASESPNIPHPSPNHHFHHRFHSSFPERFVTMS